MSRRATIGTGAILLIAAGLAFYLFSGDTDREDAGEVVELGTPTAEVEADRQREENWRRLGEESAQLMPGPIDGVALGMRTEEVQQLRPQMHRNVATAANPETPGLTMMEENLPNGARIVYAFETQSRRLQRVQVLSLLPDQNAIGPHLAAMNETYGSPTGIWSCPNTGGVPTRRFTWRHGRTTVMDIFLVYGGRISVTLYIAPSGVAHSSLRRAGCRPVQSREEAGQFPVTTPEQMMNSSNQ